MTAILGSILDFALICLGLGAVLVPAYLLTRSRAQAAADSGDDSPAAAFLLWLHPDVCAGEHTDVAGGGETDGDNGGSGD